MGVKAILSEGNILTQSVDMANKFNNFFINIGPSLSKDIRRDRNHNYEKYLNRHIFTSFHFELVDNNYVKKTKKSLRSKSSTGHDGISTKLLKFISPALIEYFRIFINQSLITGIYPNKLKIAKIIPTYKKENKLLMDNYRPIFCCHPCPNSLKRLSIINYLLFSRKIVFFTMASTVFEWIAAPKSRRSN